MRHWSQLGTRNWRAKPVRSALALFSIALGVGVVVWVTCCYESVRRGVTEVVGEWIGRAQISVESVAGRWAVFDEDVVEGLGEVLNVAAVVRRTIETVLAYPAAQQPDAGAGDSSEPTGEIHRLDLVGIELPAEERFRAYRITAGRMIRPDERDAVLLEELAARDWGLAVGDTLPLRYHAADETPRPFRIVGLVDRRRVSSHQLPMAWATLPVVQELSGFPGKIKAIDLMLVDDSEPAIRRTADALRRVVRRQDRTLKVGTTEAQLRQLRNAQGQLQFVLMLLSCVALLTAFFIILSTMSMGVLERIAQLGLLRCVGTTRPQLLGIVLLESLPLGVGGVLLGIPLGLALQWLTIRLVPEYVGRMAVSPSGLLLAVGGGVGAALLGALGPALRAAAVSPIAAARTAPARRGVRGEALSAVLGALLLLAHARVIGSVTNDTPHFAALSVAALLLLYAGYALLAPALVLLAGEVFVRGAAVMLRVRRQLVSDQVGRRPWRAGAVCCGLMVGLSLIVGLQVHSESVKKGWEFPRQFPEAMIYSWQDVPLTDMLAATRLPGVRSATVADDVRCKLVRRGGGFLSRLDPFYRFIAGDPETFPDLIQLVYLEGREDDALARLRRGGAVLVTREFSQARNIHLDDRVTLQVGDTAHAFEVAGVIASPALDIAVSFFNAGGEFQVYAVGSFIGTLADARRIFGRDHGRLLLFNFDLDGSPPEPSRSTEDTGDSADGALFERLSRKPGADSATPDDAIPQTEGHLRTAAHAAGTASEKRIVERMIEVIRSPQCAFVTARQLKQNIDRNIDRVTLLLAAIPAVGLIVAALGVANLMLANVASRVPQIAVLRAVGATRFQIIRLVVAEALILGLVGSGLGLAMGLHLGRSSNLVTYALWGFEPRFAVPWAMVGAGAGLAVLLCLLAAVAPARAAARSNVVSALASA